ncbi:hypothetical protein [Nocardia aurea]|uniref:hypothetical protein n=1 Tax=Nocardia aurea TaxID=2144174 RepID=UPI0033A35937
MTWSKPTRQIHRWIAVAFVASIAVTVVALAAGGPQWFAYLPLAPLALLLFSGIALLGITYSTVRCRKAEGTEGQPVSLLPQVHRWSGIIFILTILATFIALAPAEPIVWVSYLPLMPLAVLLITGVSMFVQLYRARRHGLAPQQD